MALLTVSSAKESVHAKSLIVDQISGKTFLNRSFKLQFFYQDIFPLNLSICVYQRFFNIFNSFPIFSYDYFRKHYAVLFGEMSKTCFTAFETIKFYSIKKNLFLYAFLSLGLSLSRLLRFYIFSLVPTKKPLTFCFLLQFYSHVPVSIESPATRTFAFCCSCPWGHTFMTSKKND